MEKIKNKLKDNEKFNYLVNNRSVIIQENEEKEFNTIN